MEKETKNELMILLLFLGGMYISSRPTLDLGLGADSPFSRYIARPVINQFSIGRSLTTEEGFNQFLEERRKIVANEGKPNLAKIVTFPFSPNYEDYKINSQINQ
ncbi:hypothetical protein HYT23_00340 [Candidatus Pacearchaeota archaeon]|nr:hypothetical protein [Candidatus Pacearchaeota archaeon]